MKIIHRGRVSNILKDSSANINIQFGMLDKN